MRAPTCGSGRSDEARQAACIRRHRTGSGIRPPRQSRLVAVNFLQFVRPVIRRWGTSLTYPSWTQSSRSRYKRAGRNELVRVNWTGEADGRSRAVPAIRSARIRDRPTRMASCCWMPLRRVQRREIRSPSRSMTRLSWRVATRDTAGAVGSTCDPCRHPRRWPLDANGSRQGVPAP